MTVSIRLPVDVHRETRVSAIGAVYENMLTSCEQNNRQKIQVYACTK